MRRLGLVLVVLSFAVLLPGRARADLSDADIVITDIGATLTDPIALATRSGDAGVLYVAQQSGTVEKLTFPGPTDTEMLDVSGLMDCCGEQGLLGLTFQPNGSYIYVDYTDHNGATVVEAFPWTGTLINNNTGKVIITIPHPGATNHNGGNIAFGPDGHFYMAVGDGGDAGDPPNNAQNKNVLLGKMLRIDPNPISGSYDIPTDNPYVDAKGADEIWARGLRNPWRWSFDKDTDDLWIGDVGQNKFEEVDFQPADSTGGENYGWHRTEGFHRFEGRTKPKHWTKPVFEVSHNDGACAIIGGFVYRGSAIPDLQGAYVYTDLCTNDLRAFDPSDPAGTDRSLFAGGSLIEFHSLGQDAAGELYLMNVHGGSGQVFRIDPAP